MAEMAFHVAGTILDRLGSLAFAEVSSAWGLKDDLEKLKKTTATLKAVLDDAESKREQQKAELRIWLDQLEDVFDDIIEVIDEFECESLRRRVVEEYGSAGRKVRRFFSRCNPLVFRFGIARQVREVRQRLDEIAREMGKFELISGKISSKEVRNAIQRETTHSFVNPSEIIGRDVERSSIIDTVLNRNDGLFVISIGGLGGIGKAALAKSVYNDERVVERFDLRMWVCAPLDFNLTETLREILKSAISSTKACDESSSFGRSLKSIKAVSNLSIDQLQVFSRSILKDKAFLLVLEDVWSSDHDKWLDLIDVLAVGSEESKIIVTARSNSVGFATSASCCYPLCCLSEEDSLSMFLRYAFGDEKRADLHPRLKTIGREIVKRCGGIPWLQKL